MNSATFQGSQSVELLGTTGTAPLGAWRLLSGARTLSKVYDKDVRAYVFTNSCAAGTKLQTPKDDRAGPLGLQLPYLMLQATLLQGQPLTLELGIQDGSGARRRLMLSTAFTDVKITALHCQVPFAPVVRGAWLNLVIPLHELTPLCFRGSTFTCLDSVVLGGSFRLRRLAALREAPYPRDAQHSDQAAAWAAPTLVLPRGLDLPKGLEAHTQVLDESMLRSLGVHLGARTKPGSARRALSRGGASPLPAPPTPAAGTVHAVLDHRRAGSDQAASGRAAQAGSHEAGSPAGVWAAPRGSPGMGLAPSRPGAGAHPRTTPAADASNGGLDDPHVCPAAPRGAGAASSPGRPGTDMAPTSKRLVSPMAIRRVASAQVGSSRDRGLREALPPALNTGTGTRGAEDKTRRGRSLGGDGNERFLTTPGSSRRRGGGSAQRLCFALSSGGARSVGAELEPTRPLHGSLSAPAVHCDAAAGVHPMLEFTPGSPNHRYARRGTAGNGVDSLINIPDTIQEGEDGPGSACIPSTPAAPGARSGGGIARAMRQSSGGAGAGASGGGSAPSPPASMGGARLGAGSSRRGRHAALSGGGSSSSAGGAGTGTPTARSHPPRSPPQRSIAVGAANPTSAPDSYASPTAYKAAVGSSTLQNAASANRDGGTLSVPPLAASSSGRSGSVGGDDLCDLLQVRPSMVAVDPQPPAGLLLPRILSACSISGGGVASAPGARVAPPAAPVSEPGPTSDGGILAAGCMLDGTHDVLPVRTSQSQPGLPSTACAAPARPAVQQNASIAKDRYGTNASSSDTGSVEPVRPAVAAHAPDVMVAMDRSRASDVSGSPDAAAGRSLHVVSSSIQARSGLEPPPTQADGVVMISSSPATALQPCTRALKPHKSSPASNLPPPPKALAVSAGGQAAGLPRVSRTGTGASGIPGAPSVARTLSGRSPPPAPSAAANDGPAPRSHDCGQPITARNSMRTREAARSDHAAKAAAGLPQGVNPKPETAIRTSYAPAGSQAPETSCVGGSVDRKAGTDQDGLQAPSPPSPPGQAPGAALVQQPHSVLLPVGYSHPQAPPARASLSRSVASSLCEVEDSIHLQGGWAGVVAADDHAHLLQFRAASSGGSQNAGGMLTGGNTRVSANGGILGTMAPLGGLRVPAIRASSTRVDTRGELDNACGLQVAGLGGPVWSNTAPSMRPKALGGMAGPRDASLLEAGSALRGGQLTLSANGQGVAGILAAADAATASPDAGAAVCRPLRDHASGRSVAVGGPLRRYTLDSDCSVLASATASMCKRAARQQERDTDWATVDDLAAPMDVAAAGRLYTPPVCIPGGAGKPAAETSRTSAASQLLVVGNMRQTAYASAASGAEQMVEVLYDPLLNCFYDHSTGTYYALMT